MTATANDRLLERLLALPTPGDVERQRQAEADASWWLQRQQGITVEEPYDGPRIKFSSSGWAAYSDAWALSMSQSSALTRDVRVMFAAMSRVNPRSGVAYFHEGELRVILGSSGEPCAPRAVAKAIASAKANGYVLEKSDARKVWLDRQHVQRGETKGTLNQTPVEPVKAKSADLGYDPETPF